MTSSAAKKERVLLVDDEPQVLVALEDLLSDDFVVMTCESSEHALRMIEEEHDLAVVVSDQRMPKIAGDELLAEVARRTTAARILLTGFADLTAVVRAVNSGHLFAYVAKPWEPRDLRLKVQLAAEHFRLGRELASERQLLDDLLTSTPDGIYFKDAELRFLRANKPYAERLSADPRDLVGKTFADLALNGFDVETATAEERQILTTGKPVLDLVRAHRIGDSERYYSESKAPIRAADGGVAGIVGIARDVTQREAQERRILRLTKVRNVLSGVNATILRATDGATLLRDCCRIAVESGDLGLAGVTGVDSDTMHAKLLTAEPANTAIIAELEPLIATSATQSPIVKRILETNRPVVVDDLRASDATVFTELMLRHGLVSVAALPLASSAGVDAIFWLCSERTGHFDAEELKLLEEVADNVSFALASLGKSKRLDFLAYYDELTNLPNRNLLLDRTNQNLTTARVSDRKVALLVIDVGRFRQVNETFGRRGGDELLGQLARRLELLAHDGITVARVDGNMFALLLPSVETEAAVASFVEHQLLDAFRQPFLVVDSEVRVAMRVGIALAPSDGDSAEAVFANAEAALKNAKANGQPYLFYAPTMNARVSEKLALETKLRRAVEREEFLLHYQPKIDLANGELVGLEALIRWMDPGVGLVPPGRFIPVLEETGLILEVGRWVLERVALQYHEWASDGRSPPRIAVNVSALQLGARDFVENLERVLRHYPNGAGVDIEITESVFVGDLSGSTQKLQAARKHGLKVAIDDFGTGYSSLAYLGRLPIDALKIDRSFVMRMADDPQTTSVVNTIIQLAHALDLEVIAEGVETAEQSRLLRLLKCDQAQGYFIARPEPVEVIEKLLGTRFEHAVTSIR
jgi:diguanylate cyclase (GGDEF)-like protein/PAS domain S-box-containing protein